MQQHRPRLRSTGYILFATALCYPAAARASAPEITIHLYDYSGIEPGALTEVQHSAGAILGQAGIDVRWRNCLVPLPGVAGNPACAADVNDATHFVVAVLPENMSRKIATGSKQFGMAVLSPESRFPRNAYVFLDRIVELAQGEMASWTPVLATVIAHEVGHLLLGSNSHFSVGIMRSQWRAGEIKRGLQMGKLTFTPKQAEQLRDDVSRRTKATE